MGGICEWSDTLEFSFLTEMAIANDPILRKLAQLAA